MSSGRGCGRPVPPMLSVFRRSVPRPASAPLIKFPLPTLVRLARAAGKNPKHSLDTHLVAARVTKYYPSAGVVCATVDVAVPLKRAPGK